jgi:hypothetical protein
MEKRENGKDKFRDSIHSPPLLSTQALPEIFPRIATEIVRIPLSLRPIPVR